jgi:subtilisin family serine protease
MSAAIVSGVVALIRSKYPDLPAYEVVNRLTATAIDRGDPGRDRLFGFGNVNIGAALTAQVAPTTSPSPWVRRSASPSASGAVSPQNPAGEPPSDSGGVPVAALAGGTAVVLLVLIGGAFLLLRRR